MAQGLSHQVKIEIIGIRAQLRQKEGEFFLCQAAFLSFGAGTKAAVQIANIGYFQINFLESFHHFYKKVAVSAAGTERHRYCLQ